MGQPSPRLVCAHVCATACPPACPPVCPPIHPSDRSWTQVHIFILALVSMWAVADKTTGFYHTDLAGPIFRSAYDGRPGGADIALYIGIADGMSLALHRHRRRHVTRAISASPTACPSRYIGITDGMPLARVRTCRYSKRPALSTAVPNGVWRTQRCV